MRNPIPFSRPLFVTQPLLPSLQDVTRELGELWVSKWLTNHGARHNQLEDELRTTLQVPQLSVFNNGTLALLVALKALDLPPGSEVITTPFTFAATPHCISWNGLQPVFSDITEDTMVLDADRIEQLITPNTSAILGVHVYGFPCQVEKLQMIAAKHRLKVVFDAAHAFGTEINGRGIGGFGDISMFSFHATKLFHTVEGGCLTYNDAELKSKIYFLRNFGINNEEQVVEVGINGKLNEIQAVIGLLNLKLYQAEKQKRAKIRALYETALAGLPGITVPQMPAHATDSLQYFVMRINAADFGITRDDLYTRLKAYNIFTRKYFHPLCSEYVPYKTLASSRAEHLPIANQIKTEVLCLPFYGGLTEGEVDQICRIIRHLHSSKA